MERLSNEPHWVLLCRVPSGDKTFSRFQKGRWKIGISKVSKPFPKTIKWKDCQIDPIGFCFADSLRGIKPLILPGMRPPPPLPHTHSHTLLKKMRILVTLHRLKNIIAENVILSLVQYIVDRDHFVNSAIHFSHW